MPVFSPPRAPQTWRNVNRAFGLLSTHGTVLVKTRTSAGGTNKHMLATALLMPIFFRLCVCVCGCVDCFPVVDVTASLWPYTQINLCPNRALECCAPLLRAHRVGLLLPPSPPLPPPKHRKAVQRLGNYLLKYVANRTFGIRDTHTNT